MLGRLPLICAFCIVLFHGAPSLLGQTPSAPISCKAILFDWVGEQAKPMPELCLFATPQDLEKLSLQKNPFRQDVQVPQALLNKIRLFLISQDSWNIKTAPPSGAYQISLSATDSSDRGFFDRKNMKDVLLFLQESTPDRSVGMFCDYALRRLGYLKQ